jgi:hypothetical protein
MFRQDTYNSERNYLKLESFGVVIEPARGSQRERAIVTVLANIPSIPYLSENRQGEAVTRVIEAMRQHTGFHLGGQHQESYVSRASYCVESSYVLESGTDTRTWTGAWTKENEVGQLEGFVPLVHRGQLQASLLRFSAPGGMETRLGELFGHLSSDWSYMGLVSVIFNIQLTGNFSAEQKRQKKTML